MIQGGGLRHRQRRPGDARARRGRAGAGAAGGARSAGAAARAAGDARVLGARSHHGEPGAPRPLRAPRGRTRARDRDLGAALGDCGSPTSASRVQALQAGGRSRLGPCAPRRAPRRPMCPHLSGSPGDSGPASEPRATRAPQVGGPASRPPPGSPRAHSLPRSPPFSPPSPVTQTHLPRPPPRQLPSDRSPGGVVGLETPALLRPRGGGGAGAERRPA